MDVYNLTNANTVFDVRTGTGRTNVRYANDPSAADHDDRDVQLTDGRAGTADHPLQLHLLVRRGVERRREPVGVPTPVATADRGTDGGETRAGARQGPGPLQ